MIMAETAQQQPETLAQLYATVAEHQAIAVELARESQYRCNRIIEMARIIIEAADENDVDAESRRIRTCAEIMFDAGEILTADAERIEIACNHIRSALPADVRS